jgi:hypothetical protein
LAGIYDSFCRSALLAGCVTPSPWADGWGEGEFLMLKLTSALVKFPST